MKTILAVASGGGHWLQLLRLQPAFGQHRVVYVSVDKETAGDVAPARYFTVREANRWDKLGLLLQLAKLLWIVLLIRPQVVISTGAAPGYFALHLGKLFGARTIWIDSIANVEDLSLSGKLVHRYADLWITQWPDLARPEGPRYVGRML